MPSSNIITFSDGDGADCASLFGDDVLVGMMGVGKCSAGDLIF